MITQQAMHYRYGFWSIICAVILGCGLMPSTAWSLTNYCDQSATGFPIFSGQAQTAGATAGQTTIGNYEVYGITPQNKSFLMLGHSWDLLQQVTSGPLSSDPGPGNRTTLFGNWYTFAKTPDYTTANGHTFPTWYVIQPQGAVASGTVYSTPLVALSYSGKFNDSYPNGPNGAHAVAAGTVTFSVEPNLTIASHPYDGKYVSMEVLDTTATPATTYKYCLQLLDQTANGSTDPGAPFSGLWGASTPGSMSATYQTDTGYNAGLLFYDERSSGTTWTGQPVWADIFVNGPATGAGALSVSGSNLTARLFLNGAPWNCTNASLCGQQNPAGPALSLTNQASFGSTDVNARQLNLANLKPTFSLPNPYNGANFVEWNTASAMPQGVGMTPETCAAMIDATPSGKTPPTTSNLGCPDVDPSLIPGGPTAFSTCPTTPGATTCPITVRWRIVDGFPNATVFAVDTIQGTSTQVTTPGTLFSTGNVYNMPEGQSYRFEVHTSTTATSPVISRSQVITATGPGNLAFSPSTGPLGTTVTITGTGFNATAASDTVKFNGAAATVTAATTVQLTTTVPVAATTGPISVTVAGITATTKTNFTVTSLPSCTSEAPTSPTVPSTATTQRIYAYGVLNATSVLFPTWWIPGNQADIQYLAGTNQGGGTWYADVPLSQYDTNNPRYGSFETDVYMSNATYANIACGGGSWTRQAPSSGVPDAPQTSLISELPTHDATVGSAAGSAGVSGGAATYTIPIVIPPGRNGMQPEVSLNYNNRSGNGVAGIGWSLSAGSSIHLCPQTMAQDGVSRAVQLDGNDRLCLDGQRLVPISSSYGTSGTIYDTEVRSFSQVTQHNALTSAASSFTVQLKNGRTLTYGTTPSNSACGSANQSQVVPSGLAAPLSWLLTRTQDPQGNWIDYCYQAGGPGEVLLSKILYTGSTSAAGNRSIQFSYQPRPAGTAGNDVSSSYIAGGVTMQTQRLTQIDTYAPGNEHVRSYTLSYTDPNNNQTYDLRTGRSLLWSVAECGYVPTTACRSPTTFGWSDQAPDFVFKPLQLLGVPAAAPSGTVGLSAQTTQVIGDLDGDGTRELAVAQKDAQGVNHTYVVKTTADRATQGMVEVTSLSAQFDARFMADFGSEGKSEAISFPSSSGTLTFYVSTLARGAAIPAGATANSVFEAVSTNVPYNPANFDNFVAAADFDGDGYIDLLMTRAAGESCGSQTVPASHFGLCLYSNSSQAALTTFAAGQTYQFSSGTLVATWNPNASTGAAAIQNGPQGSDLNGDGVPDIFFQTNALAGETFAPSIALISKRGKVPTGCTSSNSNLVVSGLFVACDFSSLGVPQDSGVAGEAYSAGSAQYWIDINGDGLTDLVYASTTACSDTDSEPLPKSLPLTTDVTIRPGGGGNGTYGYWCIKLNTGNGFSDVQETTTGTQPALRLYGSSFAYAGHFSIVDVDGDGHPEIVYPSSLAARMCSFQSFALPINQETCPSSGDGNIVSSTSASPGSPQMCAVYVCSEDPSGTLPLPTTGAPGGAPIKGLYSYQPNGTSLAAFDPSSYVMSAIRFVQTNDEEFDAVSITLTNTGEGAAHTVVANINVDGGVTPQSVYGDGLEDLTTEILGCPPGLTVTGPNNLQYQACYFDSTSSPTALPDSTPVANLTSDRFYINENIGAGQIANDTEAPILPELMSQAINGLGDKAMWDYAPLSSGAGRGTGFSALPLYSLTDPSYVSDKEYYYFQSSMPVVSSMMQNDGIGGITGFRSYSYGYEGAIYDHLGRGFQGFRKIVQNPLLDTSDIDTNGYTRGLRTVTTYAQKFPLTGKIVKQDVGVATSGAPMTIVSSTTNNWGCNSSLTTTASRSQYCPADPVAPSPVSTTLGAVYFPFLDSSPTLIYDLAQAEHGVMSPLELIWTFNASVSSASRTAGTSGWDQYGNLTTQIVVKSDYASSALLSQIQTTTTNVYDASQAASGWTDKLQSSTVTQTVGYTAAHPAPAGVSIPGQSLETVYAWNCTDRTVNWKAVFDLNSAASAAGQSGCNAVAVPSVSVGVIATTAYGYPSPSYGLPVTTTVNANGLAAARTTTLTYSADGYFPVTTKNPLNQQTTMHVRPEDGQTDSATDPNALTVATSYDGFGHATKTTYSNPNSTQHLPMAQSAWTSCATNPSVCSTDGDSAASYIVTTVQDGAPTQVVAYDLLGRVIDKASRGFNGTFVHNTTQYDGMGTTASTTAPYYQGSASYATTFKYDALNRVMQKIAPTNELNATQGNTQTTYAYTGDTTTINVQNLKTPLCSPANLCFTLTRIGSVIGKYMQTTETDPNSGTDGNTSGKVVTNYWYDGAGNTVGIQDGKGNTTIASYNAFGQRMQSADPNQGTWNFSYDGLGELISQTDARGAVTTVTSRDALGRVLAQTAAPPTSVPTGMTAEATRDTWAYDTLVFGAPTTITRQRGTTLAALGTVWSEGYTYDSNTKRLTQRSTTQEGETSALLTTYQYDTYYGRQKAVTYPSGFTAWQQYNAYGALASLSDATSASPAWTQTQTDPFGHTKSEQFGSGVVGNHTYSASTGQARQMNWTKPAGTAIDGVGYIYDSLGNLTQQARGGATETYAYDSLQRLSSDTRSSGAVSYLYDAIGDVMAKSDYSKPTYGSYVYGSSKPNAVTSVALSASGTATYAYDANGNAISGALSESYDANNQARTITRGGTVNFFYGPAGARYREVSSSETTIFGSDGYERTGTGTTATHRHELGPVVFTVTNSVTTPTYMLRDRLGSALAETDVTGTIVAGGAAKRSYDAFGKVRNGDFTDKANGTLNLQPVTLRGFTGQEHQDDVQVIHMNGRIYDYNLGRFLGVDPIIDHPLSSQSMNPYSYIGNNPLSGTDPTGYQSVPDCNADSGACTVPETQNRIDGFTVSYQAGDNGSVGQSASSNMVVNSPLIGGTTDTGSQHNGNSASGGGNDSGECKVPMTCGSTQDGSGLQTASDPGNPVLPAIPPVNPKIEPGESDTDRQAASAAGKRIEPEAVARKQEPEIGLLRLQSGKWVSLTPGWGQVDSTHVDTSPVMDAYHNAGLFPAEWLHGHYDSQRNFSATDFELVWSKPNYYSTFLVNRENVVRELTHADLMKALRELQPDEKGLPGLQKHFNSAGLPGTVVP